MAVGVTAHNVAAREAAAHKAVEATAHKVAALKTIDQGDMVCHGRNPAW